MQHDEDRYTRQRRLREIGDAGQARIEAAAVTIAGGPGALVELVYLHRAGVGRATLDALSRAPAFPHAAAFRHPAATRHAAASWRALRTLVELVRPPKGAASP
ncbi:MAG TPA: hypothetical protein VFZ53_10115 [Polyangiaceae bacterium]